MRRILPRMVSGFAADVLIIKSLVQGTEFRKECQYSVLDETFYDFARLAFEGRIGQIILMLLALMSTGAVCLTIARIRQYNAARKASAQFVQRAGKTLRDHEIQDLISIAREHDSPRAVVITSGLTAYQTSRSRCSKEYSLEAAKRASKLSARAAHFRMSRGLTSVAAIITTAVSVGIFGTCYHILTGFKGVNGPIEAIKAAMAYEYSRSLVPTAWSFLLAVLTTWAYRYLETNVNSFDLEMETAWLDLMNYLTLRPEPNDIRLDY